MTERMGSPGQIHFKREKRVFSGKIDNCVHLSFKTEPCHHFRNPFCKLKLSLLGPVSGASEQDPFMYQF